MVPHCWKCGAKLDEDAIFCSNCGTPTGPPPPPPSPERRRKEVRPISIFAIVVIAIVLVAIVFVAFAFLSTSSVGPVERGMSIPTESGVKVLNFSLSAGVARVNIVFEDDLQAQAVVLNASATGRVGFFSSADVLDKYMPVWSSDTTGNVLTLTVEQEGDSVFWPWVQSLNVTFNVRIDSSLNTSLYVHTSTGGVYLSTRAGVVIDSLSLDTTTGGVEANLVDGVVVAGDVSLKTTTGGVRLFWDNVVITGDADVNVTTTTGGLDVDVRQVEQLFGNIDLRAQATTGGINFEVQIGGDIGAKIASSVTTGGIYVDRKVGFSGTKELLQSTNYPAGHNIDVILKTVTGGINIDATYRP